MITITLKNGDGTYIDPYVFYYSVVFNIGTYMTNLKIMAYYKLQLFCFIGDYF